MAMARNSNSRTQTYKNVHLKASDLGADEEESTYHNQDDLRHSPAD